MTAGKKFELVSVEDYLADELTSDVKHEYLGGYVYAMAGARTVHNRVAGAWYASVFQSLRGKPCEPFGSDMKIRVQLPTHERFYYPDGMVVSDSNGPEALYQDKPVIVLEVLSDATRRVDEGEKRDAYLSISSLQQYLLVETDVPRVVSYTRAMLASRPKFTRAWLRSFRSRPSKRSFRWRTFTSVCNSKRRASECGRVASTHYTSVFGSIASIRPWSDK